MDSAPVGRALWCARHGNREDFVDPEWRARAPRPWDPGLSEDGHAQARELAARLAGERIDRIYASPFLRTVQTAHHCAEALGLPVRLEPGICEWLNPEWYAAAPRFLEPADLKARFPRLEFDNPAALDPEWPEAERDLSVTRSGAAARALLARGEGDLLLVGHGLSIYGVAHALVGPRPPVNVALCALMKFVREPGGWRMELDGDTSFLSAPQAELRLH